MKDQSDEACIRRLLIALDLGDAGIEIYRQRLRRSYPEESEEEISERLNEWLADRPPDSPGRVVDPSRFLSSGRSIT